MFLAQITKRQIGNIIWALLVVPFSLFPALTGMAAKAQLGQIAAPKALFSMAVALGPWTGGIASMAVIGAIFSTAPALLLVVATTMTRDLYKGFYKPDASEVEQLRFSQGIISGWLALYLFRVKCHLNLGQVAERSKCGPLRPGFGSGLVLARVNNTGILVDAIGRHYCRLAFAGNPFGMQRYGLRFQSASFAGGTDSSGPNAPSPGYLKYQDCSGGWRDI